MKKDKNFTAEKPRVKKIDRELPIPGEEDQQLMAMVTPDKSKLI